MKILIAEDDQMTRRLLQEMLSTAGTVVGVENGLQAIEAFSRALDHGEPFDLICLDIVMPELNGQEALRRIRRIEQERKSEGDNSVKVIMITALSDPQNILTAHVDGRCEAYLIKPIRPRQLFEQLREIGFVVNQKK